MEFPHKHSNHCGHIDLGQLLPHAVPAKVARNSSDWCSNILQPCLFLTHEYTGSIEPSRAACCITAAQLYQQVLWACATDVGCSCHEFL